jgi:hypothetical protein
LESASVNGQKKVGFKELQFFRDRLIDDASITEALFTATGIKRGNLPGWLDLFNLNCIVENKLEKDYHEYGRHFRSWIFKRDYTKDPPSRDQIKTVAAHTKNSKELLAKYDQVI